MLRFLGAPAKSPAFFSFARGYATCGRFPWMAPLSNKTFIRKADDEYSLHSSDGLLKVKFNGDEYPDLPLLTVKNTKTGETDYLEALPDNWHIQESLAPTTSPKPSKP